MEPKADGRLYSKVLRRSVAVFEYVNPTRIFTIRELSQEIHENNVQEFFLPAENRTIKPYRIAAYLRFLASINAFTKVDEKYQLAFSPKTLDKDWVVVFSDLAWTYLSSQTHSTPVEFNKKLRGALGKFHAEGLLPMIPHIIDEFEIESGQKEEYFRWALYMYVDAESCSFDIRHFPVVVDKRR